MKSKELPPSHQRCHHHYDNGSRCRLPIDSASEHFCGRHLNTGQLNTSGPEREAELLALYREVMGGAKFLNSATAVNHVLDNLFRLTLLGRIPQRQASKLTTQLRASLTSIRMKRDEFRVSQDDIETLLDDIDSHRESLESQVATHSDAAASDSDLASADASDQECSELEPTETSHQPRPANVAAGLDPPGLAHAKTANISTRENRARVAPHVYPELSGGASLHRDSDSGRTYAAVSNLNNDRGRDSRDAYRSAEGKRSSRVRELRTSFPDASHASQNLKNESGVESHDSHLPAGGSRNCDASVAQSANSADATSAEIFRSKDRGALQPRQIELLKREANRADRDPFFDFLPQPNPANNENNASASGVHDAPPTSEAGAWDLPEFSELRAAESRRRVADLVKGVWIGPKPNEINWDQLEQQIEYAEQTRPTPYPTRKSRRWWSTS